MSLSDLTDPAAVRAAIAEFDFVGRGPFLEKHGFRPARTYFVLHEGRRYDSKAIAGVAHGKQHPNRPALRGADFVGGEATVQAKLEALGFTIVKIGEVSPTMASAVAWAEVTSLEHAHGGVGWELGRWLWSPTASKDGAQRYAVMEQPAPGEQVFHFVAGASPSEPRRRLLFGVSRVAAAAERTSARPPLPGAWAVATAYFRIRLSDFREFAFKLPMEDIESGLEDVILADLSQRPKYYPYAPYRDGFRGAQGIYLTRLSASLAEALREVASVSGSDSANVQASAKVAVYEFAEGERSRRESAFFKRNPALRAAAIEKYGLECQGCNKTLAERYGPIGEGYIEIHHLRPLAERADTIDGRVSATKLEDVVPLCPNCHRMVHRRKPPLTIAELQATMRRGALEP